MKVKALEYLNKGWAIIPIQKGTKVPAINTWREYQTRLPTLQEVTDWWTRFPDANIALICGKISGVIVVDVDSGKGTPDLKGLELPITLCSKTGGGGTHYIYKWREGLVGAKVGIRTLVDIRSDLSYIVLPPSNHASGNNYEWLNYGEPLAEAPSWLEAKYHEQNNTTDWNKMFSEKNDKGVRNTTATQMAGKILYETDLSLWDTLGLGLFRTWNDKYNTPPLADRELLTIWESIKRTHLKNNKPDTTSVVETTDGLTPVEEEAQIVKEFKKNKIGGTFLLAKYIVKKFDIITVGESEREIYLYQGGMYVEGQNNVILPEIQRILGHLVTKSAKMETLHKIADMTSHPRTIFTTADLRFIPLKNGVFDRTERKLLSHRPLYRFTYQFPITYQPEAECPKTIKFFEQVLPDGHLPTLQEWLGYYFHRNYSFKKAIIFVGEGDTGKTTLLETIVYLLGMDNISSVSLQKMTGDKFSAAHLSNKHGNLVDELSARDISDTGNFKVATGGGLISGEYKFGNQFSFYNFSKFTFACNKIPDVSDFDDEAYFNRWIVVRFDKPIEHKIPNFIATLTNETERSGLFNYAMKGLDRLLEQGTFTFGKNAVDTKLEMMRSGSSIAVFAAEMLVQEIGSQITKEDLYNAYTDFCSKRGLGAETIKMLGGKLLFYVGYASEGMTQKNNKPVKVWRNLRLVETGEKKADIPDLESYKKVGEKDIWGPF